MRKGLRSRKYAAWLAFLCIMFSGVSHCLADQTDLLSLVRAGHSAARQSIHSFSATVTDEITFPNKPVLVQTGKYWRSFDTVRIQEKIGSGSVDFLLKDSEIHQVGRGVNLKTGEKHYRASRRAATESLGNLDVWFMMLIDFGGPSGGRYEFDRLLEFAKEPPRTNRERKDGRDCIRLAFSVVSNTGLGQNVNLWHDVARNYLVRKMTVTYDKSTDHGECDILEFTEPLPSLFVPTKCRRRSFRGSELLSREDITLSDIQVNQPIPKSVYQLPAIPAGTELIDKVQGTRYPVDENWRPIGPARPYVIMGFPGKSDSQEPGYHSQSTSEGRSFSWWLICGSLAIMAAACIFGIYRHYRARSDLHQAS